MLTNKFNLFKTFSPDDGGAGGGAPAGETPAGDAQATWEAWLEKQPEEVRKMYETHTSGLKTALNSEREKAKTATAAQKRLQELEAAEQKRKEAELSELQKAQAKLAELEAEKAQNTQQLKTMRIKSAVQVQALKLGFQDPEDAYRLADLAGVEVGEDGSVTGIDKALKALSEGRPYLLKVQKAGDTDAGAGGGKPKKPDEAAAIARRFGLRG